ncbi:MAG TPA: FAD-binding and (Fe-S)-binding domain-containing protein [Kineosporiaceae bacterium]|nr:FAD-binding and (Fe-S)-binding domain-containing protein [Kineosporiaceae bacterium]
MGEPTGPDPREVAAALLAAGAGEVDAGIRRRVEYSSDASLYRVLPAAVVFPRSAEQVQAALDACRTLGVPLTARGAGTSIAGNAVGPGVVLDFSRHLNRIRSVDAEAGTAVVDPGVVLDDLQRAAAPHRLRFGPDPSTHSRATLGGMIGNNACGSRALGYGRTADNLIALDVLAGNGERLTATRSPGPRLPPEPPTDRLTATRSPGTSPPGLPASATLRALDQVVRSRMDVIRTELGRFPRQVSGYSLEHLLPERGFDVAAALAGTEGTCAVLLGATVRLVRTPARTLLLVLGYPDMAQAADAVPALLPHRPVAVEGLDARIVDVVRTRHGASAVPQLPRGSGWLFVELAGDDPGELADRAAGVTADAGALAARTVPDSGEAAALWRIREDGAGLVARAHPDRPVHAGWEDAAVPPDRLGAYLREFDALLAGHGLSGVPYGHFGDGCVHVRIDFPLGRPGGTAVFTDFLADATRLVARHGGSVSGEHGDGRARSALLPLMYSPAALEAFAAVKAVFDPDRLLNPGVLVDPAPVDADLRAPAARPLRDLALPYPQDGGDLSAAVHRCTGVARCRDAAAAAGSVMCPSYRATGDEKDSTRARSRVLQELARGSLPGGWRSPALRQSLDLCLSCKGCAIDCPTGIDVASYRTEWLYQAYRHRPRPPAHYVLGSLPRWVRAASRLPGVANRAMTAPGLSGLGKRLAGVDPRRDLPALAPRTFRDWFAARTAATATSTAAAPTAAAGTAGDPVLLWVDTFTDHFSPQVGIAAVRLLESAGFTVTLPPPGLCCGLTWISTGRLRTARTVLTRTLDALAPGDLPIVGLEPSCTAVLRRDAEHLLGRTGPVEAVAARTRTLAELLLGRPGWTPPSLAGTALVAQPHCHHHAVLGWEADRELLTRTGADLHEVGGCCGMAGNFGAERGHFDMSVAVARTALLPAVEGRPAATVLADGFSCRTQLDQLAGRPGIHLAQLLAAAVDAGTPGAGSQLPDGSQVPGGDALQA